jgi:hypothetical protein
MALDPRETDRMGEEVARRIGVAGMQLAALVDITEAEMAQNLARDAELARLLAMDALA